MQIKKLFIPILMIILILVFLSFTACSKSEGTLNNSIFDENDNGKEIVLQKNDEFHISLESNPTTGYQWNLDDSLDQNMIKFIGSEYEQSQKDKKLIGSGGIETFSFKANDTGITEIKLTYIRPWEEKNKSDREFHITVTVK